MEFQPRSYGPLSSSLRAPSPAPRRAFSLPTMRSLIPSLSSTSHILPLSSMSLPGSPGGRTAKRLSYTLRSRASHYKLRVLIGTLVLAAVYLFVSSSTRSMPVTRRLRARGQTVLSGSRSHPGGVSIMDVDDTDEWLAEEDLYFSQYTEDTPLSPEDAAAEAEMASRQADVIEQNRQQSLRALTWWLAEGGEIPEDWEVPSKAYLKKVGGRGVERLLEDIEDVELGDEPMFEEGWADFAKKRYRTIVFSKTHCPYSRKAKQILSEYPLSPAPFIVELDTRPDTAQLQDLLLHLTGRRTVPNILLDFVSIGGSDDLTLMHSEGGLRRKFQDMGVLPGRNNAFRPLAGVAKPVAEVAPPHAEAVAVGAAAIAKDDDDDEVISPAKLGYTEPEDEDSAGDSEAASDGDDDDEETEVKLSPGTTAEDIRAAVQAAHGDSYLSDGEDDDEFGQTEEFARPNAQLAPNAPPTDSLPMSDDLDEFADAELGLDDEEEEELGMEDEADEFDEEDDEGEWEDEDEEEDMIPVVPQGGGAAKAKAVAEAAKVKAAAEAEAARVKEALAKAEAELKKKEELAAQVKAAAKAKAIANKPEPKAKAGANAKGVKAKGKPKAKANLKPKPVAKVNPDSLVKKADTLPAVAKPITPVQPKPKPIGAQAKAAIPPPAAPPAGQFKEVNPPPKKADTLLDRSNANALQKKKAAVQAAKDKAAAAKGKKGAVGVAKKAAVEKKPVVEKKAAVEKKPVVEKKAAPAVEKKAAKVDNKKPITPVKAVVPAKKAAAPPAAKPKPKSPVVPKPVAQNQNQNQNQKVQNAGAGKGKAKVAVKKEVEEKGVKAAAGAVAKKDVKAPVKKAAAGAAGEKIKPKARTGPGAAAPKAKKAPAVAAVAAGGKRKGRVL